MRERRLRISRGHIKGAKNVPLHDRKIHASNNETLSVIIPWSKMAAKKLKKKATMLSHVRRYECLTGKVV